MPQPPGIIDRVNYVVETWNNPCNAPWYVYLETAQPAALEAVIMLACFDFDDVVRYVFRPANLRGGGHLRRGRKGVRGARRPRLGERIRNKIAPLRAIKNRKVVSGVKTLWVIDGIGQRLLWWWLVVDIATGFAYNWTSQLYKTEFCQQALGPGALGANFEDGTFGGVASIQAIAWLNADYQTGGVTGGPIGFELGPGDWNIECAINAVNTFESPAELDLRLIANSVFGSQTVLNGVVNLAPGQSQGLHVSAKVKGPGGFGVAYLSGGGFTTVSGILYVQGVPEDGVPPPLNFKCNSIFWPPWL